MSDEDLEENLDEDPHEWEYYQESEAEYQRKEAEKRFKAMPVICQHCRWLDWYYLEECNYRLWPVNGKCPKYCRDYSFIYKLPSKLGLFFWDIQYRIWNYFQNKMEAGG